MRKIKKDDDVIVIAGKDKGNRGSVLRVLGDRTCWLAASTKSRNIRSPIR